MKLVVFGLTVSSAFGNGHATLWRGLCNALGRRGHSVVFFERDVPYYASHRDLFQLPGGELVLYPDWAAAAARAAGELATADVGMVTSYCPDAREACALMMRSRALKTFYDLDTPVTLGRLEAGEAVPYLPTEGLGSFDLVLSYGGGPALELLSRMVGAKRVAPLYGSVDPEVHAPLSGAAPACDLSYLGTYAADRQTAVEQLFLEPARRLPERRFVLGGSMYPEHIAWPPNIARVSHVPPPEHRAFYGLSPLTLSTTRRDMARLGFCPSGRLFEAAACGVPVLTDAWPGLEEFFQPGHEILVARTAAEAVEAINTEAARLAEIGRAARVRVLRDHTGDHRAEQLLTLLQRL